MINRSAERIGNHDEATQCDRFDDLLTRDPDELDEEEWEFVIGHESACAERHSARQLELSLGLCAGALEHGDQENGVPSIEALHRATMERIAAAVPRDRRHVPAMSDPGDRGMLGGPAWRVDPYQARLSALPTYQRLASGVLSFVQFGRRGAMSGYMGEAEHPSQSTADPSKDYLGVFRAGQEADIRLGIGVGRSLAIYHIKPDGEVDRLPSPTPADHEGGWVLSGVVEGPAGRHCFLVLEDDAEVIAKLTIGHDKIVPTPASTTSKRTWEYDVEED